MKRYFYLAMIVISALVVAASDAPVHADAGLVTIPKRGAVQLTIYNSEDLTLVKEKRRITLKKGINCIEFAWAGTLIDPTSAEFKVLDKADKVEVLDVSYPPNRRDALRWTVSAEEVDEYLVQTEYFTSGMSWSSDYILVADPDEGKLHFRNNITVINSCGEDYPDAQTRLVVGTVNLVEKIRDLAGPVYPDPGKLRRRLKEMEKSLKKADKELYDEEQSGAEADAFGYAKAKKIIKEGLSEYFIYSIEGTETIPNRWSKKLKSLEADEIPFELFYRHDTSKYGGKPVKCYKLKNDEEHKLGETPLPDGQIRVFRKVKNSDALSYLGQSSTKYVPIGSDIEVNLGADDLLSAEIRKVGHRVVNLNFDNWGRVVGYDTIEEFEVKTENFSKKNTRLEMMRYFGGDFDLDTGAKTEKMSATEYKFHVTIPAGGKTEFKYKLTTRHGKNAKKR
ncbi:MAG: DUF4139 domain-containing protein [Planctomycetota bacterium]